MVARLVSSQQPLVELLDSAELLGTTKEALKRSLVLGPSKIGSQNMYTTSYVVGGFHFESASATDESASVPNDERESVSSSEPLPAAAT